MKVVWVDLILDNRQELCQKYNLEVLSQNRADEDILLESYHKSGEKILQDIIGIFAFAIWDEKRGFYWCARDELGLAAFYYTFVEGAFLSASSLTLLLDKLPYKLEPNLSSMQEFAWYGGYINPELTMYEGIYRLPPGHQMIVKNGKTEVSRYWDPKSIKINHNLTFEEASSTLLKLFREAVSCRLAKKEATGCELSGGLDSSSVFCVGKEQGGEMEAYSMRFGEMHCDEGIYIDEVLEHTGERGVSVATGKLDFHRQYDLNFNYRLSPHWPLWSTSFLQYPMLEAMQENGIHTALTGQGGDQALMGSHLLCFDYLKRLKLRAFWKEYKALGFLRRRISKYFIKSLIRQLIPATFLSRLKTLKLSRYALESIPTKSYQNYAEKYSYHNSFTQTQLIHMVTSAAHSMFMDTNVYKIAKEHYGIDFYHPFYDLRVVEFLLSIPPEFNYSEGKYRQLHRESMKGILPEDVRMRKGKAFFNELIIQHIEALDLDPFWSEAHIVRLGVITQETLDRIRLDFENGDLDSKMRLSTRYWQLINLEQWYRFNYDSERA